MAANVDAPTLHAFRPEHTGRGLVDASQGLRTVLTSPVQRLQVREGGWLHVLTLISAKVHITSLYTKQARPMGQCGEGSGRSGALSDRRLQLTPGSGQMEESVAAVQFLAPSDDHVLPWSARWVFVYSVGASVDPVPR